MPTLERRVGDGEYYVRHYFHQHNTWQVLGEGVRILGNRGVTEGKRFSTDLFMDLWMKGLVYHGRAIPLGRPCRDPRVTDDFANRVAEFYGLVYAQRVDAAWTLVAVPALQDNDESPEVLFARFTTDVRDLGLVSWKLTDRQVYDVPLEVVREGQPVLQATRLGIAYVRLTLRAEQRDVKQYWLYSDGKWWVMSRGFGACAE